MCGICGFNWKDEKLLDQMMELIKHRGPDDRGVFISDKISLGHNRLSIIDLSSKGKNPIWNEKKDKCIIFNGEIYNYKLIREELIKKGYIFKTKTDTEVILYGYEEYGKDILKRLNGMFAFVIYDLKKDSLFLARDRLGIKPLYYYYNENDNRFIFSSEIKAILKQKIPRIANLNAISEYLTFQNILDDKTFFDGIRLVLPGDYLILENKKLKIEKYWRPIFDYKKKKYNEILKEFRLVLDSSVERHMISDVPVGTYLSGGFDSTSITKVASKKTKNKLKTFTCKFDIGGEYDETPCAREVAKEVGALNYEIEIKKEDFIKNIENMIYHMDEPKVGIPVISQYHLSQLVSKHVKVVLTGHAGDELFAGYPVFQAKLYQIQIKNPLNWPKILYKILKDKKRLNILYYLVLPIIYPEIKNGIIIIYPEKEKKKLLTKEFLSKTKEFSSKKSIKKVFENRELNSLEKLQYLYLRTYLPSLFIAEDKMGMAHSIEARIPLCDNEMVSFANSIENKEKLRGNNLKSIIKDSMREELPSIIYKQEKRGFPTPLGPWLKGGLSSYFKEILLSDKALSRKIYKKKYVNKLLKKTDFWSINKLWCLLNIELWFRIFIDNTKKI